MLASQQRSELITARRLRRRGARRLHARICQGPDSPIVPLYMCTCLAKLHPKPPAPSSEWEPSPPAPERLTSGLGRARGCFSFCAIPVRARRTYQRSKQSARRSGLLQASCRARGAGSGRCWAGELPIRESLGRRVLCWRGGCCDGEVICLAVGKRVLRCCEARRDGCFDREDWRDRRCARTHGGCLT